MENNGQSDIVAFWCVFRSLWQINSTASGLLWGGEYSLNGQNLLSSFWRPPLHKHEQNRYINLNQSTNTKSILKRTRAFASVFVLAFNVIIFLQLPIKRHYWWPAPKHFWTRRNQQNKNNVMLVSLYNFSTSSHSFFTKIASNKCVWQNWRQGCVTQFGFNLAKFMK